MVVVILKLAQILNKNVSSYLKIKVQVISIYVLHTELKCKHYTAHIIAILYFLQTFFLYGFNHFYSISVCTKEVVQIRI